MASRTDTSTSSDVAVSPSLPSFFDVLAAAPSVDLAQLANDPEVLEQVGKFVDLARIGGGGFGDVYSAFDTHLKRRVALKVLKTSTPGSSGQLLGEARKAAAIDHPNVAMVHEVVELEGGGYIVMQYVDGATVRQLVAEGRLTVEDGWRCAVQIAEGLAAAHEGGVIHRDLSFNNVMIDRRGIAKIVDFGLAKRIGAPIEATSDDGARAVSTASIAAPRGAGTRGFVAPEVLAGGPADVQSDIYSLGVLLRFMLSNATPTLLTGALRQVAERCCAPRQERYADAHQVSAALHAIGVQDKPGTQRSQMLVDPGQSALARGKRRLSRRVMMWAFAALGVPALGFAMYPRFPARTARASAPCILDVAVGGNHTCALKNDRTLWCWGSNDAGQLGDGTFVSTPLPVQVKALGVHVVQVIAGESHTCARKDDGTLWCWGYNASGEVGDGTRTTRQWPVKTLDANVIQVAAGQLHTCARKDDGTLWCWGNNHHGELANDSHPGLSPLQVTPLRTSVVGIAVGGNHSCARMGGGGPIWCWGRDHEGQLGTGMTTTPVRNPVKADPSDSGETVNTEPSPVEARVFGNGAVEVATGFYHSCAHRGDGILWCWGANANGQLGDGTKSTPKPHPVEVTAIGRGIIEVSTGYFHTCARKGDGSLWCWGSNGSGQLGDGTTVSPKPYPTQVTQLATSVTKVSTKSDHTCAIDRDGALWCWGRNGSGQVGDGTMETPKPSPTRVMLSCPRQ